VGFYVTPHRIVLRSDFFALWFGGKPLPLRVEYGDGRIHGAGCMKKFLVAGIAAAAFCGAPAIAADVPVKTPIYKAPAVALMFDWTGFYAGINGGYGWGRESWVDNVPGNNQMHSPNGGVFGGQLGYRAQMNHFVLGIEGTWDWAGLDDTNLLGGGLSEKFKVKSLYTVTGQAGLALDRWLMYVKGGWAGATDSLLFAAPGPVTASNSQTAHGWTIGGGIDYALWQNLILGVEYDHFNLNYGAYSAPVNTGGSPLIVTNTSHLIINQVVARLSYKFN
jgi:outer membrane immunogenic protein